jgi:hypothetical protein
MFRGFDLLSLEEKNGPALSRPEVFGLNHTRNSSAGLTLNLTLTCSTLACSGDLQLERARSAPNAGGLGG